MKISILTPTYNRAYILGKLYNSIIKNSNYGVDLEWLIMDDGSTDQTKILVKKWKKENKVKIKYYYQENKGKMLAINNLIHYSNGELIIECDSDDYFTNDAFKIIKEKYEILNRNKDAYALVFIKNNQYGKKIGSELEENKKSTMFELYFKEKAEGDKALVFRSDIRKKYKHKLEKKENFVTEARMYNEIDKQYKIITVNIPIMICEYKNDGYSKNIIDVFKNNPYGYYEYFKQLFSFDFKGISIKKRLYIIKHYILFSWKTKQLKSIIKNIDGVYNKLLIILLCIPGIIKAKLIFK